jgi:hypothetical protein
MAVAVEDAREGLVVCRTVIIPDGAGPDAGGGQVDIRHQPEMLVPVAGLRAQSVHLGGGMDKIGVIEFASAAAVLTPGGHPAQSKYQQKGKRLQNS